jgi:hypothetical protein
MANGQPDPTQQPLPQVNPAMLSQLASLFPQQAAQTGGLPPAMPSGPQAPQMPPTGQYAGAGMGPTNAPLSPSGGMPSAGPMQDYANLAAQQQAQLLGSAPAREAAADRASAQRFAGEAADKTLPQMAPHIQKGAGFLHNLGQALQLISMATAPGQALFGPEGPVYGQGTAQYKATQAGLMGKKQAAESAAEGAEKEVGAVAGVTGRTILGGAKVESTQMSVEQRAAAVATQFEGRMAQLKTMKDIATQKTGMQEIVADIKASVQAQVAAMGNATKEDVAHILTNSAQTIFNSKSAQELGPALINYGKGLLGLGNVEAPGGESPVTGNAPLATRGGKPGGTTKPTSFKEGATATGPNGHKIKYSGGKWVDAATGAPVQ